MGPERDRETERERESRRQRIQRKASERGRNLNIFSAAAQKLISPLFGQQKRTDDDGHSERTEGGGVDEFMAKKLACVHARLPPHFTLMSVGSEEEEEAGGRQAFATASSPYLLRTELHRKYAILLGVSPILKLKI